MWFHTGCIDVKFLHVTLPCMSRPHHSAWHAPLMLIDLVSYSWFCTICPIMVLVVHQKIFV